MKNLALWVGLILGTTFGEITIIITTTTTTTTTETWGGVVVKALR